MTSCQTLLKVRLQPSGVEDSEQLTDAILFQVKNRVDDLEEGIAKEPLVRAERLVTGDVARAHPTVGLSTDVVFRRDVISLPGEGDLHVGGRRAGNGECFTVRLRLRDHVVDLLGVVRRHQDEARARIDDGRLAAELGSLAVHPGIVDGDLPESTARHGVDVREVSAELRLVPVPERDHPVRRPVGLTLQVHSEDIRFDAPLTRELAHDGRQLKLVLRRSTESEDTIHRVRQKVV